MDARHLSVFQNIFLIIFISFMFVPLIDGAKNSSKKIDKNEMGMESLYKMVHVFLGDIVQTKNISDSFLNLSTVFVDGDFDRDSLTDWKEWADYLIGFAVCVAIGLLFIVVMPIAGFIFCCCRLCGKCGGKKRPHETKHSKCKRQTFCTLLVLFNTLALAGVVCAFICNSLIYKNLKNDKSEGLVGHIQGSLHQIQGFANNAVEDVSNEALRKVEEVSDDVVRNITETSNEAVEKALASLNATVYLKEAEDISKGVNDTRERLHNVKALLDSIILDTKQLKENLSDVNNTVSTYCSSSQCPNRPDNYRTTIDFSKLDDISDETRKVDDAKNMDQFIAEANERIKNAQEEVRQKIDVHVDDAKESIKSVNSSVMNGIDDLKRQRDDAVEYLQDAYRELDSTDNQLKDHADSIYYAGIGVCCAYLLIVVLYYVGIMFGLCGERPGDGAPCCNRGAGSKFLMGGISMTFILSWILMLLCTIMFVIGGLSYTEVCRYFVDHDPQELKVFDITLDKGLDLSGAIFNDKSERFSLSNSLSECQNNTAVYTAFKLEHIVDLDNITNLQSLQENLNKLKDQDIQIGNITILDDGLKQSLTNISEAGLQNINYTEYINETEKNVTSIDLNVLAKETRKLAPTNDDIKAAADQLEYLAENVIPKLKNNMTELRQQLILLRDDTSFHTASIEKLIKDLETSQNNFNAGKDDLIKEAVGKLADNIFNDTTKQVKDLKEKITKNIGQCGPVSEAFFSLTDSACVLAVDPLNGLWFSFGWCLFFFILCLVFAIPLTTLYRCEHKFEKEFDDPNYVMYGGPNPDTIPLTRGNMAEYPL